MAYKRISPQPVVEGGTGLSTITTHDLLIGNGTSAPNLVAPSATSGVPVISNGAAADPVYGTAVVAGGGTGATSFTAFAVITGGTTSTGALQNVSGVGTSGQVLTSAGAGALPTWSNGGWVLIQSQTASSSASLAFTSGITTTYNVFAVTLTNVKPANNNDQLFMDWSTNAGVSYINANYQSGNITNAYNSNAFTNTNSTTSNPLTSSGSVSSTNGFSGVIYLYELPSASAPYHQGEGFYGNGTAAIYTEFYGLNTSSTAINAIKFSFSGGNIASGTISLYGINK